ncbi:MAG: transcription termination factor Rho [Roseburia sp.]|nr:transcription termination factor Rho [Roseburia sp.]
MREKYESLSLAVLRDVAKSRGLKNISAMKKADLVELMLAEDEKEKQEKAAQPESGRQAGSEKTEKAASQTGGERTEKTERVSAQRERSADTRTSGEGVREKDSISVEDTLKDLDSGISANGILEVMPDGYGFIRCENYLPGEHDVYVSPSQIRKFNLKTGDIICGNTRIKTQQEKFSALLYVTSINGYHPSVASRRKNFEDLTPIFPNRRLRLERPGGSVAMRIVDLVSPIGKGQRGMIVSQPKAGKTTLLKEVAKSVSANNPEMHLIILLIDERPEEVTDIKEAIEGDNVEVIYSTFDELPEHHKRVSEMVIERAKRLVEHGKDVMILLDSITRLARAYNLTVPPSGRTLSGGLDPAALHMPKRFFGAARNMREGGSLTVLATALVDTGSKMDDVVYEEFKGTGNMELVLDRKLSEKRVFPAIDIVKSGTRREDLLLEPQEQEAVDSMRKAINGMRTDDAVENILNMFARTKTNQEYINMVKKTRII